MSKELITLREWVIQQENYATTSQGSFYEEAFAYAHVKLKIDEMLAELEKKNTRRSRVNCTCNCEYECGCADQKPKDDVIIGGNIKVNPGPVADYRTTTGRFPTDREN